MRTWIFVGIALLGFGGLVWAIIRRNRSSRGGSSGGIGGGSSSTPGARPNQD